GPLGVLARAGRGSQPGSHGQAAGVGHLRADRALPDQLVEPQIVTPQLRRELRGRAPLVAGGPDRLVGLLRVLRPLRVRAGTVSEVVAPEKLEDLRASGGQR